MRKTKIAAGLAAVLLLLTLSPAAYAEETEATEETVEETAEETKAPSSRETSGTCGDNLTWSVSGSTLTISGSGAMAEGSPWKGHKDRIKTLILTGGVTTVGSEAFAGFENLTDINFGDSLKEIHEGAFRECVGLTEISLPDTFRLFERECFYGCTSLETVYCAGGMPSFRANCLWTGNFLTFYYPAQNPWPMDQMQILSDNFGGKMGFYAMSSDTPKPRVVEAVETQPPAAPAAEPTDAPATAPTQPVETVPVTQPAVPTVPETTAAETTVPETTQEVYTLPSMVTQPPEEEAQEDGGLSGGIIGIILIAGVLTFFLAGALIARSISRRRYED